MNERDEQPSIDSDMCPHGNFSSECAVCKEKQEEWDKLRAEVDTIADANGKGIDKRVKEPIIGLTAHEFPTEQSCEGHLYSGADPYPWIRVGVDIPKEKLQAMPEKTLIEDAKKTMADYVEQNEKLRERLQPLVDEFNARRDVDQKIRIEITDFNIYGHMIMKPVGAEYIKSLSEKGDEKEKLMNEARKEMSEFGEFLKAKFFQT